MNWQEILTILVPLLGLMGWVYSRTEKNAEKRYHQLEKQMDEKFKLVDEHFKSMREELREMRTDIKSIDQRLTRLEGRFDERGYWESRKRTGTDDE